MKKVLHQGELIQKQLQEITKTTSDEFTRHSDSDMPTREYSSLMSCSKWQNQVATDTEDELFLVIENNNDTVGDNDSGVFITKEQRFVHDLDIGEPMTLPNTPKRKFRYSRDFESLKDHALNTFNPQEDLKKTSRASIKFEGIHKEVRSKMDGMKEILEQEHSFLRKINKYSFDNQSDFEFVDDINDYCDKNETMIV